MPCRSSPFKPARPRPRAGSASPLRSETVGVDGRLDHGPVQEQDVAVTSVIRKAGRNGGPPLTRPVARRRTGAGVGARRDRLSAVADRLGVRPATRGIVMRLRKPSASAVREFLAAQARLDLTYPAVGATAAAPPPGYAVDHTRV